MLPSFHLLFYFPSLGADIIYDPVCVPHLVRVLSMLLKRDGRGGETNGKSGDEFETESPVAYIATVVRNIETFNCFTKAAADAKLSAANISSSAAPSNFLPYMLSYDRSSVQLLKITTLSYNWPVSVLFSELFIISICIVRTSFHMLSSVFISTWF